MNLFFFLLSLLIPTFAFEYQDIVLQPLPNKSGDPAVLYYIQGADINTSSYVEITSRIQQQVSFPLWVGLPQMVID